MESNDILTKAIIVAAHPDDEILWFSSLLNKVEKLVLCYLDEAYDPDFGKKRRNALLNYPLKNMTCLEVVTLGLRRPKSFLSPKFNQFGIELIGDDSLLTNHKEIYKNNYRILRSKLSSILARHRNVITHNPWGEYGHEEHVQVYRVVKDLQDEMGYDIWFSNYCSNATISLVPSTICMMDNIEFSTDYSDATQFVNLYKEHECWTWFDDWRWLPKETFIKETDPVQAQKPPGAVMPLNVILMQVTSEKHIGLMSKLKNQAKKLISVLPHNRRN